MIKSKEEEDFIEDYLLNQKKIYKNVWIGAKRNNARSEFRWVDGTRLEFSHWKEGEPNEVEGKNCVQIIGNLDFYKKIIQVKNSNHDFWSRIQEQKSNHDQWSSLGQWSNTECGRHLFNVLCEKPQEMTFSKLTSMLLDLKKSYEKEKKELKDTIANMQTVENDLKHTIDEMRKNESELKAEIDSLKMVNKTLTTEMHTISTAQIIIKEKLANVEVLIKNTTSEVNEIKASEENILEKLNNTLAFKDDLLKLQNQFNIFNNSITNIERTQSEMTNFANQQKQVNEDIKKSLKKVEEEIGKSNGTKGKVNI